MRSITVQRWGAPARLLDLSIGRPRRLLGVAGVLVFTAIGIGEQDYASVPFALACLAVVASVAFAISRRPTFSGLLAVACLGASGLASAAKFKHMAVNAHVLDLYLYVIKPEALLFIITEFRYVALAGVALIVLAGAVLYSVLQREQPRTVSRRASLTAIGLSLAFAFAVFPSGSGSLSYHMEKSHFVTSFFVSIADAGRLAQDSELKQRLSRLDPVPPFVADDCGQVRQKPDIVMTLSESMVPPARIPEWRLSAPMAQAVDDLGASLRSFDGKTHGLRVETYGGGTWVSEAQLLTGLSMADLGWRRPYATLFLEKAVDHSLPSHLKRCGYRTVAILPLPYNFVNEGPFLTSLGFDEVLDYRAIGAATKHEADAVYFDAALNAIERSRRSGDQPLFLFVLTMAAHSPYDFSFRPEVSFGREPVAGDAQAGEYLRRTVMARRDHEAFLERLAATVTGRGAVVVDFGDHQPIVTRPVIQGREGADALAKFGSSAYETFYSVRTFGLAPKASLPDYPLLDLGYVGLVALEVAGLPLSPVYAEQRELRERCAGAFHGCEDRDTVDRYIKRQVDSGLLRLP